MALVSTAARAGRHSTKNKISDNPKIRVFMSSSFDHTHIAFLRDPHIAFLRDSRAGRELVGAAGARADRRAIPRPPAREVRPAEQPGLRWPLVHHQNACSISITLTRGNPAAALMLTIPFQLASK